MTVFRLMVPYLIAVLVFAIDQCTKEIVLNFAHQGVLPHTVTDFFQLTLVFNRGASFGFLNNGSTWSFWILTAVSTAISVYLIYWILTESHVKVRITLGFILGGALGNIFDRLFRGAVVDFLDFFWHDYHWPAFNIADSCIVLGVVLLIILSLKKETT